MAWKKYEPHFKLQESPMEPKFDVGTSEVFVNNNSITISGIIQRVSVPASNIADDWEQQ